MRRGEVAEADFAVPQGHPEVEEARPPTPPRKLRLVVNLLRAEHRRAKQGPCSRGRMRICSPPGLAGGRWQVGWQVGDLALA
jgi:hypothetical protein